VLIPGGLYTCRILRVEPDRDYLLLVAIVDPSTNDEKAHAFIHKQHLVKNPRPGELVLATYTGQMISKYPVFSQKIPQHIINVVETFFSEELRLIGAILDRAAATRRGKYCKIGVWGKAGLKSPTELNQIIFKSDKIKLLAEYIPQPIFIPGGRVDLPRHFTEFPVEFMINALYPAPLEKILDWEFREERRALYVVLKASDFPIFLWKDYLNAKLAAKLTKVAYHFVVEDTGQELVVDPYNVEKFFSEGLIGLSSETDQDFFPSVHDSKY